MSDSRSKKMIRQNKTVDETNSLFQRCGRAPDKATAKRRFQ